MKKALILQLFLVFSITIDAYCDDNNDFLLRHSKGSKGILLSGGLTSKSYYGSLGYAYYFEKNYFVDASLQYEDGEYNYTGFNAYLLSIRNNFTIFEHRKSLFINAHLGAFIGNERLKDQILEDNTAKSYTVYGLLLGVNAEYYISNKLSLVVSGNQNIIYNSPLRDYYLSFETGLKFFF